MSSNSPEQGGNCLSPSKRPRTNTASAEAMEEDDVGESSLLQDLTEEEWATLEDMLSKTEMMVTFSMNETSIEIDGCYVSISNLAYDIVDTCRANDVLFLDNKLSLHGTEKPFLTGRPAGGDGMKYRNLWKMLKPGYVMIRGVYVWMQPAFTGRAVSNLSLTELEYSNTNAVTSDQLFRTLRLWGSSDVLVLSHASYMGKRQKWPAISCLRNVAHTTPDLLYSFRLFFPSEAEANSVYKNYLASQTSRARRYGDPTSTVTLKLVTNVEWDRQSNSMYRPSVQEQQQRSNSRVIIFGLNMEISTTDIERAFALSSFRVRVEIRGGRRLFAVADCQSRDQVEQILNRFGPDGSAQLKVGNIPLVVKRMEPRPPERRCFNCRQLGHFRNACPRLDSTSGGGPPAGAYHPMTATREDSNEIVSSTATQQQTLRAVEQYVESLVSTRTAHLERQIAQLESQQRQTDNTIRDFTTSWETRLAQTVTGAMEALADKLLERATLPQQNFGDGSQQSQVSRSPDQQ